MKTQKIAPITFGLAIRIVKWNHSPQRANASTISLVARPIINDAKKAGFELRLNLCDELVIEHKFTTGAELLSAVDTIQRNHGRHATPTDDRERRKKWMRDMDWYNSRRYTFDRRFRETSTCLERAARNLRFLRDSVRENAKAETICFWAKHLTKAYSEQRLELAARMNQPETVTQSLIFTEAAAIAAEMPF